MWRWWWWWLSSTRRNSVSCFYYYYYVNAVASLWHPERLLSIAIYVCIRWRCRHSLANMKLQRNSRFFLQLFQTFDSLPSIHFAAASESFRRKNFGFISFTHLHRRPMPSPIACEKSIRYGQHDVHQTKKKEHFVLQMALNCCRRWMLYAMHPNVVALCRPSASELRWFLFIFAVFNAILRSQHSQIVQVIRVRPPDSQNILFVCHKFLSVTSKTNAKKRIFHRKSSGNGLSVRYSTDWADQINKADGFVLYFSLCFSLWAHCSCDLCTCTNTSNSIKCPNTIYGTNWLFYLFRNFCSFLLFSHIHHTARGCSVYCRRQPEVCSVVNARASSLAVGNFIWGSVCDFICFYLFVKSNHIRCVSISIIFIGNKKIYIFLVLLALLWCFDLDLAILQRHVFLCCMETFIRTHSYKYEWHGDIWHFGCLTLLLLLLYRW